MWHVLFQNKFSYRCSYLKELIVKDAETNKIKQFDVARSIQFINTTFHEILNAIK